MTFRESKKREKDGKGGKIGDKLGENWQERVKISLRCFKRKKRVYLKKRGKINIKFEA